MMMNAKSINRNMMAVNTAIWMLMLFSPLSGQRNSPYTGGLSSPAGVYISWAAHDQLSDTVKLTEKLAMKQLQALIDLKKHGVQIDYYLMDMFWFDKRTGFRTFDTECWPNGPDRWLQTCKDNGIKPGLWLSTNIMGWSLENPWMLIQPEWKSSGGGWLNMAMSLTTGHFLEYHIETMQYWYDKGIRMFKFDFANFEAATAAEKLLFTKEEIVRNNETAWYNALKLFRLKNPDVVLLAYNGYGGEMAATSAQFAKTVNLKWLDVFESLYCGDPRPADVPCMNFWRSKDIYSDHMVFQYQYNGVSLDRIDNSAFMIGTTGTCYNRGKQAWRGMLILSGARGGWMNTYYGNMDLLSPDDAKWFAKTQKMFFDLQEFGRFETFGSIPASAQPYGFIGRNQTGALYTVVNPTQEVMAIPLPDKGYSEKPGRLLFADAGFEPVLTENSIVLGPEQFALVGAGSFANQMYELGVQDDVIIPLSSREVPFTIEKTGEGIWLCEFIPQPNMGTLRFVFNLENRDGKPIRITGGELQNRVSLGQVLRLEVVQANKQIPVSIQYDKKIWSGLSWVVAEVEAKNFTSGTPVKVQLMADPAQAADAIISGKMYSVKYP